MCKSLRVTRTRKFWRIESQTSTRLIGESASFTQVRKHARLRQPSRPQPARAIVAPDATVLPSWWRPRPQGAGLRVVAVMKDGVVHKSVWDMSPGAVSDPFPGRRRCNQHVHTSPQRWSYCRTGHRLNHMDLTNDWLVNSTTAGLWGLVAVVFVFLFFSFSCLGVTWKTYWGMKGTLNPQSRGTSGWLQGAPWCQKRQKCPPSNTGMLWLWSPMTHLSHCSAFSGMGPLLTMSFCIRGSWEAELFRNTPQENTGPNSSPGPPTPKLAVRLSQSLQKTQLLRPVVDGTVAPKRICLSPNPQNPWMGSYFEKSLCRLRILRWEDHPGLAVWTTNPVTSVLGQAEEEKTHMEGAVGRQAETRGMQPPARARLGPPEATRGRKGSPDGLQRGYYPADTLILGFWPPKLKENKVASYWLLRL